MTDGYRYALELHRTDGRPLGSVALDEALSIDWLPAQECVRFLALRRGRAADAADGDGEASVEPVWHARLGRPFVEAFKVSVADSRRVTSETFTANYLKALAERASSHFVSTGALGKGERAVFVVAAYPADAERLPADPLRLSARDVSPPPPIAESRLDDFANGGTALGPSEAGDMPVFVPGSVLDEAASLAASAGDCETGGVLVGRLHRDSAAGQVFAAITVQIPARHTAATSSRLTFTPETWTDVRAAITLRRSDEVMLGWWHSHPVRVWCRDCPPERQAVCPLAAGFFSEHDRALHRAMFPRAYSVGLLVNDRAAGATFSLFGWRRGLLALRGFSVTGDASRAVVSGGSEIALTECDALSEGES